MNIQNSPQFLTKNKQIIFYKNFKCSRSNLLVTRLSLPLAVTLSDPCGLLLSSETTLVIEWVWENEDKVNKKKRRI